MKMPRHPFSKTKKFNGKIYSFHEYFGHERLAKQKAERLRNKGLLARVAKMKSSLGGDVFAVYERQPSKKHRKRGYMY